MFLMRHTAQTSPLKYDFLLVIYIDAIYVYLHTSNVRFSLEVRETADVDSSQASQL